jgi:hypothetical protein
MDPRLRYWDDNTDGDIPTTFGVIPYWDDSTGECDSLCLRGHSINKTKTNKDPSEKKSLRFLNGSQAEFTLREAAGLLG